MECEAGGHGAYRSSVAGETGGFDGAGEGEGKSDCTRERAEPDDA